MRRLPATCCAAALIMALFAGPAVGQGAGDTPAPPPSSYTPAPPPPAVAPPGARVARRASRAGRTDSHGYIGGLVMGLVTVAQNTDYQSGYLGRFGGGIGMFFGWRFGEMLALEANWTFRLHDEAWKAHHDADIELGSLYITTFTLDAKLHLPASLWGIMQPYVQAGAGLALAGAIQLDDRLGRSQGGLFAKGIAFNAGVGLDIWVSQHVSFGGRLLYRGVALGAPEISMQGISARNFASNVAVDAFAQIHF
jgi:hypothetical protein